MTDDELLTLASASRPEPPAPVTAPAPAPAPWDAGDIRPFVRMAAALRRDIAYGHIPPGALIPRYGYAERYHAGPATAHKALKVLERQGLAWSHDYIHYAAPAGPPDPAVAARLGATLARLREAADRGPADLATGRWDARHVAEAENGTWQPRDFWAAMDTALGADGTLLKVHDNYYAGPVPDAPDPGPLDPGPPVGTPRDLDAEAAATGGRIAARLAAGEWPPGTILPPQQTLADDYATQPTLISLALRRLAGQDKLIPVPLGGRRFAYLVPGHDHPAPAPTARTLASVILLWDDGTRTRLETKEP